MATEMEDIKDDTRVVTVDVTNMGTAVIEMEDVTDMATVAKEMVVIVKEMADIEAENESEATRHT